MFILSFLAAVVLFPHLLLSPALPPPSCPVGCDDALTSLASVLGGAGIFVSQWRGLVQE